MNVVRSAVLLTSIAAGFFFFGLMVGHYQFAPFNSIKDLKRNLDFGVGLTKWMRWYLSGSAYPESQKSVDVVMLGDSITAGADWKSMLPQVRVMNLGVAGDTSAGVLNRLDDAVGLRPRMVFLMIGINDVRKKFPVELVETHIELAAERLIENGITPIVQSTLYVSSETLNEKVKALNTMMRAWCTKRSIFYIDLNDVLSADGVLLPRYTEDGSHLNEEAYRLWGEVIRGYVMSVKTDRIAF